MLNPGLTEVQSELRAIREHQQQQSRRLVLVLFISMIILAVICVLGLMLLFPRIPPTPTQTVFPTRMPVFTSTPSSTSGPTSSPAAYPYKAISLYNNLVVYPEPDLNTTPSMTLINKPTVLICAKYDDFYQIAQDKPTECASPEGWVRAERIVFSNAKDFPESLITPTPPPTSSPAAYPYKATSRFGNLVVYPRPDLKTTPSITLLNRQTVLVCAKYDDFYQIAQDKPTGCDSPEGWVQAERIVFPNAADFPESLITLTPSPTPIPAHTQEPKP